MSSINPDQWYEVNEVFPRVLCASPEERVHANSVRRLELQAYEQPRSVEFHSGGLSLALEGEEFALSDYSCTFDGELIHFPLGRPTEAQLLGFSRRKGRFGVTGHFARLMFVVDNPSRDDLYLPNNGEDKYAFDFVLRSSYVDSLISSPQPSFVDHAWAISTAQWREEGQRNDGCVYVPHDMTGLDFMLRSKN